MLNLALIYVLILENIQDGESAIKITSPLLSFSLRYIQTRLSKTVVKSHLKVSQSNLKNYQLALQICLRNWWWGSWCWCWRQGTGLFLEFLNNSSQCLRVQTQVRKCNENWEGMPIKTSIKNFWDVKCQVQGFSRSLCSLFHIEKLKKKKTFNKAFLILLRSQKKTHNSFTTYILFTEAKNEMHVWIQQKTII